MRATHQRDLSFIASTPLETSSLHVMRVCGWVHQCRKPKLPFAFW